jgi:endosialidase-like protein
MGIAYAGGGTQYGIEFKPGADNAYALYFLNAAGTGIGGVSNSNIASTYNTTSDRRIKENITDSRLGLSDLMRLNVRDFTFIKDPTHAKMTGFIAQELKPVFPAAVTTNGDNGTVPLGTSMPWGVDYGRITPLIVKAVQELKADNDNLRHEVEELRREVHAR